MTRSRRYLVETVTYADYADDKALANTPIQAESRLHRLEQATGSIGLHVNTDKTECMGFIQEGEISTLNGGSLKLVGKSTYHEAASHRLDVTSICA